MTGFVLHGGGMSGAMTVHATLGEGPDIPSFVGMRAMAGGAAHRIAHAKTFAGTEQPILVAVYVYIAGFGGCVAYLEIIGQGISRLEFEEIGRAHV